MSGLLLLAATACGVTACGVTEPDLGASARGKAESDCALCRDEGVSKIAAASRRYALDLYRAVAAEQSGVNLALAPAALYHGWAMVHAAARDETAEEICRHVLDPDGESDLPDGEDLYDGLYKLGEVWRGLGGAAEDKDDEGLRWGSRLFIDARFEDHVGEEFASLLEGPLDSPPAWVDFAGDAEAQRKAINAWAVADARSAGRVTTLIPQEEEKKTISDETTVVLASAMGLALRWAEPFAAGKGPFQQGDGKRGEVPVIHRKGAFRHAELEDGAKLVEIPAAGGRLVVDLLIPAAHDGLAALEKQLDADAVDKWLAALPDDPEETYLELPRYAQDPPGRTLRAAHGKLDGDEGVEEVFGDEADLSGLLADPEPDAEEADGEEAEVAEAPDADELRLAEIHHRSALTFGPAGIDTEGEAAEGERQAEGGVRASHPFLYLVRDRASETLLFIGRVADVFAPGWKKKPSAPTTPAPEEKAPAQLMVTYGAKKVSHEKGTITASVEVCNVGDLPSEADTLMTVHNMKGVLTDHEPEYDDEVGRLERKIPSLGPPGQMELPACKTFSDIAFEDLEPGFYKLAIYIKGHTTRAEEKTYQVKTLASRDLRVEKITHKVKGNEVTVFVEACYDGPKVQDKADLMLFVDRKPDECDDEGAVEAGSWWMNFWTLEGCTRFTTKAPLELDDGKHVIWAVADPTCNVDERDADGEKAENNNSKKITLTVGGDEEADEDRRGSGEDDEEERSEQEPGDDEGPTGTFEGSCRLGGGDGAAGLDLLALLLGLALIRRGRRGLSRFRRAGGAATGPRGA